MTDADDNTTVKGPAETPPARKPARNRRGVALVMVLFVVTILTVVSVEFQYESRVYLQTTANFRDRLRAQYLGRSALQITRLLLYFQTSVDQMIKQYFKTNPPNIQLWQMIPIDSDLARALAGGFFAAQDAKDQQQKAVGGTAGEANPDTKAAKEEAVAKSGDGSKPFGAGEGFGEFEGHFHSDVTDEESKINLNVRPGVVKEANLLRGALERLFAPVKYNPLFENADKWGRFHDREEIINSILDWIDPDTQRAGVEGGDEASRYDFLEDRYVSKNHFFDSLEEIQLVAGIDDRFYKLFADSLTIYRTTKINVNTCGPEVMRALLEQYLAQPLPGENEMQRILDTIMDFRVQNSGFWNEQAFVNFLTQGPELTLEFANGAAGKTALQQNITVSSGIFMVKAEGDVNGVMQSIKAIVTKKGALLYYRIE